MPSLWKTWVSAVFPVQESPKREMNHLCIVRSRLSLFVDYTQVNLTRKIAQKYTVKKINKIRTINRRKFNIPASISFALKTTIFATECWKKSKVQSEVFDNAPAILELGKILQALQPADYHLGNWKDAVINTCLLKTEMKEFSWQEQT